MANLFKDINWRITPKCNYDCWFCILHNNKLEDISKLDFFKIVEFINSTTDPQTLHFYLTGGEPTISPYFLDAIKFIKSRGVSINTNLSQNLSYWENNMELFKSKIEFLIKATYHAQYENLEEYYNKMKFLYENKIIHKLNIVIDNNEFDYVKEKYYELYIKVKENMPKIQIRCTPVNSDKIPDNILNLFHKDDVYKRILNPIEPNPYCYRKENNISYDGKVYHCISSCTQGGKPLYSIFDPNALKIHNIMYNTKMKCSYQWCCSWLDKYL